MMWRFFMARKDNPSKSLGDNIGHINYHACETVWHSLDDQEREIQEVIYNGSRNTAQQRASEYATANGLTVQSVWSVAHRTSRKLAVTRGLIADYPEGKVT